MRKMPGFVLLRAFESAARLESFAMAARELHLTPSAVSHHIRDLESYFDRPLFTRLHRRVELTAEGRRFARRLSPVFDDLEAVCGEMTARGGDDVLVVHCAPSLAAKWLGPRLPQFMRAHPGVTINLSSGAQPLDLNDVRDIDVTISYGHALERPGIDVVPLGAERILPLCAPSLLQAQPDAARLLAEAVLIDSQLSPVTWRDWFTHNRLPLPPAPRPSFDRAALAIAAAVDGMGITLESERLAARELAQGALVEVGADRFAHIARDTHFLSCRSDELRQRRVAAFRGWLLAECGIGSVEGERRDELDADDGRRLAR